jgi:hypothetical protein
MDIMNIKGHPPWYARGTPVTNIRDGPAMAINHKLLFAICRGPSASEKPMGKTHRWLTLKTTFFNMQNSVYSQWYGLLKVLTLPEPVPVYRDPGTLSGRGWQTCQEF